jgi:hypothetical protein
MNHIPRNVSILRRCQKRRWFSHQQKVTNGATATEDALEDAKNLLRAPFQKVVKAPLFPWRHEEQPLERLMPGTRDYQDKGLLLGGGLVSSMPALDAYATAFFFLDVSWKKLIFIDAWKADLADSLSWAFAQGVAGILSNAYRGESSRDCCRLKSESVICCVAYKVSPVFY